MQDQVACLVGDQRVRSHEFTGRATIRGCS
jgi:hypothetical protein